MRRRAPALAERLDRVLTQVEDPLAQPGRWIGEFEAT